MSELAIAGGTYIEQCEVPRWSELYGSGTRAAAALSGRGIHITLRTCIGESEVALLGTCAATFGFTVEPELTGGTVGFHYLHSLAPPDLYRPAQAETTNFSVSGINILRFGMIEASAVVHGERVVYDPQSPCAPEPFRANGSTAKQLAVVLNRSEASYLTGTNDVAMAGTKLLALESAEVAIIKDGPYGATVFTAREITQIPAYRTRNSWLLGSGDVFSAVFAYAWMIEQKPPDQAANEASLAAAFYCQSKVLPVPSTLSKNQSFHLGPISHFDPSQRTIYLSGPSGNLMQLWCLQEAKRCLQEQGFDVFSPYHVFGSSRKRNVSGLILESLGRCDLVFAILDGFDPNTVYEVGYARALGKPIVAFSASRPDNQNGLAMFEDKEIQILEDLPTAVYASVWS